MKKESVLGFLKDNYLIILIFIAGVIPRFYDLGGESVWYDEAVSIAVSKLGFADILRWVFDNPAETNPPFYYTILSFWVPVFGDSEFIARVPSAVLGSLSVFAVYAVGKLLYNKKTGLIAALIVATSVFHIRYAQEARGYTLMVCLMLVSYYCLLQLTIKNTRIYAVIYVASTALLVYTHYYGVMIILAQNIFCFTLLIRNKKIGELGIGGWFKLQVITALFLLPCFVFLAVITLKIQKGFWVPEPSSEVIWQYFTIYAGSIYLLILFSAFSLYSIIGLREFKGPGQIGKPARSRKGDTDAPMITKGERVYLLLLWMLVPVLVPFLISLVSSPILIFRYTIGASLAFYLLASNGIGNMNNRWLILAAAGLIIIFSYFNISAYYKTVGKHQWREVMSHIESNARPGDIIVVSPIYERITAAYYNRRKDIKIVPLEKTFPSFEGLGDGNIWFVFHAHPESRKNTREGLGRKYTINEMSYYRLDLFQLREKSSY
jgi:uncharacterized membrane protein